MRTHLHVQECFKNRKKASGVKHGEELGKYWEPGTHLISIFWYSEKPLVEFEEGSIFTFVCLSIYLSISYLSIDSFAALSFRFPHISPC